MYPNKKEVSPARLYFFAGVLDGHSAELRATLPNSDRQGRVVVYSHDSSRGDESAEGTGAWGVSASFCFAQAFFLGMRWSNVIWDFGELCNQYIREC